MMLEAALVLDKEELIQYKEFLMDKTNLNQKEQFTLYKVNLALQKIKETEDLMNKPVLFNAVYDSGVGFYDGVTRGQEYPVLEELEDQYVIINDNLKMSMLNKSKFTRPEPH
ncbi:gp621 [Bacillus phage G]|uniref:Gp621 n=1 Tax=Bacillus phage G TaxID=2884420 RepID=G3MB01_9CAUD|nr:gp621 [Bacillus phage G]AEO93866.1 gp621 [Bacillus phage G]